MKQIVLVKFQFLHAEGNGMIGTHSAFGFLVRVSFEHVAAISSSPSRVYVVLKQGPHVDRS